MARKRSSDEDALKILREIDVHLHDGLDAVSSCRKAGISDKTFIIDVRSLVEWDAHSFLRCVRLKRKNERLKNIVAELQLDKLILKESLDYLKPKA